MTDTQINAAIAEVCGWEHKPTNCGGADFCNDLNAMHEAEKVLNSSEEKMYFANLKEIVGDLIWYRDPCKNYRATARERAEAFLKTLGKWEEGE
jgi:hypothetical protein